MQSKNVITRKGTKMSGFRLLKTGIRENFCESFTQRKLQYDLTYFKSDSLA